MPSCRSPVPNDDDIRRELLNRAIALGDELVRLADDLGQAVAGTHISQGLEMMRAVVAKRH